MACVGWVINRIPIHLEVGLTIEMFDQPQNELPFDLSGGIRVVGVVEMRFWGSDAWNGMCGMG